MGDVYFIFLNCDIQLNKEMFCFWLGKLGLFKMKILCLSIRAGEMTVMNNKTNTFMFIFRLFSNFSLFVRISFPSLDSTSLLVILLHYVALFTIILLLSCGFCSEKGA